MMQPLAPMILCVCALVRIVTVRDGGVFVCVCYQRRAPHVIVLCFAIFSDFFLSVSSMLTFCIDTSS